MNSLKIKNLSIAVKNKFLFKNLSFSVMSGQIVGICEPTGKGKSTLLNFIAGILDEEKFLVEGTILKEFQSVSYVFQNSTLLENRTVLENVILPIEKIYGKELAESKAINVLHAVELDDKCEQKAKNLSGGEKQRVAIARAFVYPGELLLLDEPFHSQDETKKNHLIELTKELVKMENRGCIIISHDKEDFEKLGASMISM